MWRRSARYANPQWSHSNTDELPWTTNNSDRAFTGYLMSAD
ncbi:hypothetical protein X946_5512 [Burkholderia sp. ABCPW 111]|nr:hypothetical protein X946_5512 [Burkholderia sp. ABCPW 111]